MVCHLFISLFAVPLDLLGVITDGHALNNILCPFVAFMHTILGKFIGCYWIDKYRKNNYFPKIIVDKNYNRFFNINLNNLGLCGFYAYVALSAIYYDSVVQCDTSSYVEKSVSYLTSRYVKTIWGFAFLVSVNPLIGKNGYTVESEMIRYVFMSSWQLYIWNVHYFINVVRLLLSSFPFFCSCAPNWAATDSLSLFYNCSTMILGLFVPSLLILTANGLALRVWETKRFVINTTM